MNKIIVAENPNLPLRKVIYFKFAEMKINQAVFYDIFLLIQNQSYY